MNKREIIETNCSKIQGYIKNEVNVFKGIPHTKPPVGDYIGEIVKTLREKGLLFNTWIVYNSDHVEMLGDHYLNH